MKKLLLGEYTWELGRVSPVGFGFAYTFRDKRALEVFCKTYLDENVAQIVRRIYRMNRKYAIRFEKEGDTYWPHHNPPEDYIAAGLKIIQFKVSSAQRSE